MSDHPKFKSYDVVIIGGAIMGSATAWFLSSNPDFNGRVLVVERDISFADSSTMRTNSCMRQQFSTELNVHISQFAADFVNNFRTHLGDDPRVPELSIKSFGYMYLAGDRAMEQRLRRDQAVQVTAGAATELLSPEDIAARYPFYNLEDVTLGSINTVDEGYWDGAAVFDWLRRKAREGGVEYIENTVTDLDVADGRVTHLHLAAGTRVACGQVVNAAGPRASDVAAMAGIDLPVEPRKRYTWVFRAERPLDRPLPLTIDPSGVHVHDNGGGTYLCGSKGFDDPAVAASDFAMDFSLWEGHVWPALAHRIPQFEAIRVQAEWAGHYAMNTLDQNAIVGPHPDLPNFLFLNGFSGHGLQQAPAMGRGLAEWITYGNYRSIDLSPFSFDRIAANVPLVEHAVI
ncbi:FAD-dependent oxidoreductase [Actibacterium mucosum KCTC 23349]|uniref:FAD-dependent oxidoreductase n=1 Tax=Actibacterium mucosum KCTC 23349 TaxID=1454373 RepID=A0A037ZKG7_9RHOB|nr:FAD-binding oxidoreductase [Actibacterium mucosum]KAJ56139.1 FAD-dependent oxidoreductase [Actibacterium mucosum KCTC 23349]